MTRGVIAFAPGRAGREGERGLNPGAYFTPQIFLY